MTGSATLKLSSLAKRTSLGADLNVSRRNGCVTAILIALTELTKTPLCITAPHRSLVPTINSLVRMDDVSTKDGRAITTTIAATALMKESSATPNTKPVRRRNSPARTSNVFAINTDAVRILITKLIQRNKISI